MSSALPCYTPRGCTRPWRRPFRRAAAKLLSAIVGGTAGGIVGEDAPTDLPLDQPPPAFIWQGSVFVFTGKFAFGTRRDCEREVIRLGALCEPTVTRRTTYLVSGTFGIGAAQTIESELWWRLVLPWHWLVGLPAWFVRLPFLILRRAGVPARVEENVGAYILKVILTVIFYLCLAYLGIRVTVPEVVSMFRL